MGTARSVLSALSLVSTLITGMAFAQVEFTASDTSMVSKGTAGTVATPVPPTPMPIANQAAINAKMSRNGRFVVFESTATNLVDRTQYGPISFTPGRKRVYLLDRQTGIIELVSFVARSADDDTDGDYVSDYTSVLGSELEANAESPAVSGDGRYVAFVTASNARSLVTVCPRSDTCHINKLYPGTHVYVRDRWANETFMADQATLKCTRQAINNQGVPQTTTDDAENKIPSMEQVACRVSAVPLPVDPMAGVDVVATPAPVSANPNLSGDGQFVVFDTNADNISGLAGTEATYILPSPDATPGYGTYNPGAGVEYHGKFITAGVMWNYFHFLEPAINTYLDHNGVRDVYVRDGSAYTTKLVSLGCKFHSPDGCAVQGQDDSIKGSVSDDGARVAFESESPFLFQDFNDASDIFLVERSRINGEVADLSRISNNTSRLVPGNDQSIAAGISGDGRYIIFESSASNIINGDTNGVKDVFVYDSTFFQTVRCTTAAGVVGNGDSMTPAINGGGDYVAFESTSTNWGVSSGVKQIYLGKLSKDSNGKVISCTVTLGTGAAGNGANGVSSNAGVGVVPFTSVINGTSVRITKPAVSYQSDATDVQTDVTDDNGVTDVFHAPKCSATDAVTDTDGDGTVDCFDACWKDDAKVTDTDTDSDGVANCEDGCVDDPQKLNPGLCGCGVDDVDTDSDFIPDCRDQCPSDPLKSEPKVCGCGQPETDANGNGTPDCKDSALPTPAVSPTPGPVGTGTPQVTATPTATPVPFNLQAPQRPTIRRRDSGSVQVHMSLTGINGSVQSYRLYIYKRLSSGWTKVQTKVTKSNLTLLNSLRNGTYRVNFQVANTAGQRTKLSPNSVSFAIR